MLRLDLGLRLELLLKTRFEGFLGVNDQTDEIQGDDKLAYILLLETADFISELIKLLLRALCKVCEILPVCWANRRNEPASPWSHYHGSGRALPSLLPIAPFGLQHQGLQSFLKQRKRRRQRLDERRNCSKAELSSAAGIYVRAIRA